MIISIDIIKAFDRIYDLKKNPQTRNRKKVLEHMTDFIFLSSKIIAESDRSHEIKRRLLLGRKAMSNLDSI